MRSRMIWVAACAAAVSALAACSGDDDHPTPTMNQLSNQPGAAGAPGTPAAPSITSQTPAPSGGGETPPPPQRVNTNNGTAAGSNSADAGAGDAGLSASDAGAPAAADAGAPPPRNPPGNPPPASPVGFSDVFQLLLDNCGSCHGANAPGNRPRFAQAGNEMASFMATQAMSNGGTVAARIIARAVTARTMPPACGGGALGTGQCLDANEAAQLQAWLAQGAQP